MLPTKLSTDKLQTLHGQELKLENTTFLFQDVW